MFRLKLIPQLTLLYLLLLGFFSLAEGAPKQAYLTAEFLCDHAETLDRQDRKEEAVQEFSKALLLDPKNGRALAYLQKMGLSEGIYQPPQNLSYLSDFPFSVADPATVTQPPEETILPADEIHADSVEKSSAAENARLERIAHAFLIQETQLSEMKAKIQELQTKLDEKNVETESTPSPES